MPGRRSFAWLRVTGILVILAAGGVPLHAQDSTRSITWTNHFMFYADNTEFFNPYSDGQTLLGANFSSALSFRLGKGQRHQVLAGVFGIMQSGDTANFLASVRPVLSYRYHLPHDTGVLGTLITVERHGYLPNLEATNLDILRPIEYGGQWIDKRKYFEGQVYINWQALNTIGTREVFDYGWLLTAKPLPWVHLNWQAHGLHRGGQQYTANEPVRNNYANGLGLRFQVGIPIIDSASFWAYRFWSSGNANTLVPDSLAGLGTGTFLQAGIKPKGWLIYAIWWWGTDYLANEGDPNYNSIGKHFDFYQSERTYREIGVWKRATVGPGIGLEGQFRLINVGAGSSISIGSSSWEYAYRFIVRVPFDVLVWKEKAAAGAGGSW